MYVIVVSNFVLHSNVIERGLNLDNNVTESAFVLFKNLVHFIWILCELPQCIKLVTNSIAFAINKIHVNDMQAHLNGSHANYFPAAKGMNCPVNSDESGLPKQFDFCGIMFATV